MHGNFACPKNIAVIGTGISGMSAAWLLSQQHDVTVYESDRRVGGHSNTVMVAGRERRHPGRYRLHRLQRGDLSQSHRAVRASRRADAAVRHVVCGVARRRRPGIFRHQSGRAVRRSSAICSGRASGRCCATCSASIAMRRATSRLLERVPHHARRLSGCRRATAAPFRRDHLLPMAAAIWSAPASDDPGLSGRRLHPLPRQSWPAAPAQPAALAHRRSAAAAPMSSA